VLSIVECFELFIEKPSNTSLNLAPGLLVSIATPLVGEETAVEWVAALTSSELKFSLNACQDTLPHNSNFAQT